MEKIVKELDKKMEDLLSQYRDLRVAKNEIFLKSLGLPGKYLKSLDKNSYIYVNECWLSHSIDDLEIVMEGESFGAEFSEDASGTFMG